MEDENRWDMLGWKGSKDGAVKGSDQMMMMMGWRWREGRERRG